MVQNQEINPKIDREAISPEDVGSADILVGTSPEFTPEEATAEKAVGKKKEEIDWSPVESSQIIEHLDAAAKAFFEIGTERHRNDGSTKYVAFTKGKRRTVACVYLSTKSARISVGKLNGKSITWPKALNYQVTKEGYFLDGEEVKLTTITSKVKALIKSKGW
jgi:hypothetical protein